VKARDRAEALGYRLEQDRRDPKNRDRWRVIDLYSDRAGQWMTFASILAWLDRQERARGASPVGAWSLTADDIRADQAAADARERNG
jgi:hypothetical protein